MTTNKPRGTFTESYNYSIAASYHREIRSLIRRYYTMASDDAVELFLHSGDFAELTAAEFLARSGLDMMAIRNDVEKCATKFVTNLEMQSNAKFRNAYVQARKPMPAIIRKVEYGQKQKNLISLQVNKITNLVDYQRQRIEEVLTTGSVQDISLSGFKQMLRDVKIYDEKKIKAVAYNQLHYATTVTNTNKALELGLNNGIWRHPPKSVYKTEPRKSHEEADGKRFKLDKGCKIEGEYIFCGQKPFCKCYYEIEIV